MINPEIKEIFDALTKHRFVISNEKVLQLEIENIFKQKGFEFKREYYLDEENKNIIDFLMSQGIGIEVKIKANKRAIYKQLLRYSEFEEIKSLILVTGTNTGMPKELNGKPVYILNISRAWL